MLRMIILELPVISVNRPHEELGRDLEMTGERWQRKQSELAALLAFQFRGNQKSYEYIPPGDSAVG